MRDGALVPPGRMEAGVEFVRERRAAGENVLIACWEGMSRSSTFVMAYLIEALDYDLRDAWDLLRARHSKASPAREMWQSLLTYYKLPYTIEDVRHWLNNSHGH